jgi:myo-inositol-1(or 4)-monophosphatase
LEPPGRDELDRIRDDAVGWVRAGGAIAMDRFGRVVTSLKADRSFVTDADHAVQAALLARISERYPSDAVISEETQADPESHASAERARRCWVVDPIDGTRSYARGFPGFCVSVGLLDAGVPVVGVIHNPLTGQTFSAAAGCGAWCDARRISVRSDPLTNDTLMAIPSRTKQSLPSVVHAWVDRVVIRNLGSTALHLALTAGGALDATFADECRLWDIAAGAVILREAGGRILSLDGRDYFPVDAGAYRDEVMPFIAGGPTVVEDMLREYRASLGTS